MCTRASVIALTLLSTLQVHKSNGDAELWVPAIHVSQIQQTTAQFTGALCLCPRTVLQDNFSHMYTVPFSFAYGL